MAVSCKYSIGCARLLSEEKSGRLFVEEKCVWEIAGRETVEPSLSD
jgi:hypothetical protein